MYTSEFLFNEPLRIGIYKAAKLYRIHQEKYSLWENMIEIKKLNMTARLWQYIYCHTSSILVIIKINIAKPPPPLPPKDIGLYQNVFKTFRLSWLSFNQLCVHIARHIYLSVDPRED